MSETPRDQRALWREVSRTFEEFGEALRVHLSPDAARTPSDPTAADRPGAGAGAGSGTTSATPGTGDAWAGTGTAGAAGSESAPWTDRASGSPGRPGEGAGATDSDWVGPTGTAGTESAPWADPARPGEGEGAENPWAAATAADTPSAGTGPTGGPGGTGTSTSDAGDTAAGGTGAGRTGGRERGWREWSGTGGGRFATQADWESARESVRDLGSSARRLAAQAGDAARDPHVRDSAQRAARSLGDAIVTTVEDFATDLRSRMRNPRWSDASRPAERPPVAPIDNDHEDKP